MLNRLQEEINKALKNKDSGRLSVIRMLLSDVKNEAFKEGKKRTPDEVVLAYYKKLCKIREEFGEQKDFVKKLDYEINIVSEFLPKLMDKFEIFNFIKDNFDQNSKEVSMKTVMPLLKGKADGKLIQEVINLWVCDRQLPPV